MPRGLLGYAMVENTVKKNNPAMRAKVQRKKK